MWKKILFDFDFPPLQHIHTTLISRSFSTFFPLFSPFFFQPGLSTHRSSRAAFDKPYTHTHIHVPFKQANRVRSVLRISSRYSLPPLIFATGFIYYADSRSPLSPLFIVPLDQLLPRRLISFHRQTTSIVTSIVEPSTFTGEKYEWNEILTRNSNLYRWKNLHKIDRSSILDANFRIILSSIEFPSERKERWRLLTQRNELWCVNKID